MTKKTPVLLAACTTIMLCVALIAVGTYALFSDSLTVKNHLQAGTLQVKLERTALKWAELDNSTGYMKEGSNTNVVDFTQATNENIFGIAADTKIVPGCFYEATLKLTNSGSVAFDYAVDIVLDGISNALAEQLNVTVDTVDKGALSVGTTTVASGALAKNEATRTFVVKIEFVNNNDINNDAQALLVNFDLIVTAIQATAAPTKI